MPAANWRQSEHGHGQVLEWATWIWLVAFAAAIVILVVRTL